MICPTCRGRQFISQGGADDDEIRHVPCPDCIGGVASCCDAAGSSDAPSFACLGCGAIQEHNIIRCEQCGEPLVFPKSDDFYAEPMQGYRDDVYPERLCDHCGTLYRGPAVYCSLDCALRDA